MSSTQYFNLNINPQVESAPPVVHVSQFDNTSRQVVFSLYDNDAVYNIPSGTSAVVEGTKGDNTGFSYNCSFSGNKVTVTITEQMTIIAGPVMCELMLKQGNTSLGTANFFLHVEPAAMQSDVKISETDIPAIRLALKYANSMETDADKAAKSAAAAKTSETNAASSASKAKTSEANAKTSETNAKNSQTAAKTSETNAASSASAAKTSETNAKNSQTASKASETNAKNSETTAKSWAVGGTNARDGEDTDNAKYYSSQASSYASAAKTSQNGADLSASAAKTSEANAVNSATAASNSQTAAKTSENNAKTSETNAATSAANAKTSETNSKASETNASSSATAASKSQTAAKTSETNSKTSENTARSWAIGGTGTRDGEDTDNAKYYSQIAKTVSNTEELMKKIEAVDQKKLTILVSNGSLNIDFGVK